ncbi:MAG: hypothetical protein EA428_12505, partial [Spirochaetaceae bacterium]
MTTHNVKQVSMQHNSSTNKLGLTRLKLLRGALSALLLGGLLLFTACEDQPFGIFASIEREQDVPDSELGEDATIVGMARLGNEYWLSYMRVQRRPVAGGPRDWGNAPHPAGFTSSGDHAISLVGEPGGGVIYAAFRNNKATSWNVYKRESVEGPWISLGTQGHQIIRLFLVNNELFGAAVAGRNSSGEANSYKLVQIGKTAGAGVIATQDTGGYPVRGGAFFEGNYTFFTRTTVFRGNTIGSLPSVDSIITQPRAAVVFNDGGGDRLYISGQGGVAVSDNGTTFTTISGGNTLNGFGVYTSGTVNYLIVGSQDHTRTTRPGDGYYLVAQDAGDGVSVAGTRATLARITGASGNALGAQSYEG